MADYLSCTASGAPQMPDLAKFSTPPLEVTTLNLFYNNKIVDKQLVDIAKNCSEYERYSLLSVILHISKKLSGTLQLAKGALTNIFKSLLS